MNSKRLLANCTLLSLSSLLLLATWAQSRQEALSGKLIRLHVLAESDSEEDQAKKLCARDAVLALLTPELEGVKSREEAETVIRRLTPAIRLAAEKAAGTQAAVQLSREYYPTRRYGTFPSPPGSISPCASRWDRGWGTTGGAWSTRPCAPSPPRKVSPGRPSSPRRTPGSLQRMGRATSSASGCWSFGESCGKSWRAKEKREGRSLRVFPERKELTAR